MPAGREPAVERRRRRARSRAGRGCGRRGRAAPSVSVERRRGRLVGEHVLPDRVARAAWKSSTPSRSPVGLERRRGSARDSRVEHAARPARRRGRVGREVARGRACRARRGRGCRPGRAPRARPTTRAALVRPRPVADEVAEAPELRPARSASIASSTASSACKLAWMSEMTATRMGPSGRNLSRSPRRPGSWPRYFLWRTTRAGRPAPRRHVDAHGYFSDALLAPRGALRAASCAGLVAATLVDAGRRSSCSSRLGPRLARAFGARPRSARAMLLGMLVLDAASGLVAPPVRRRRALVGAPLRVSTSELRRRGSFEQWPRCSARGRRALTIVLIVMLLLAGRFRRLWWIAGGAALRRLVAVAARLHARRTLITLGTQPLARPAAGAPTCARSTQRRASAARRSGSRRSATRRRPRTRSRPGSARRAGRPLGHARSTAASRPARSRSSSRTSSATSRAATLEGRRLVRAARVPARLRARARRRGGAAGMAQPEVVPLALLVLALLDLAVDAVRRTSSPAATRPRPTGGARRRRATRRRRQALFQQLRERRASSSPTRRPGRTSGSTTTRRSMQRIAMAQAWAARTRARSSSPSVVSGRFRIPSRVDHFDHESCIASSSSFMNRVRHVHARDDDAGDVALLDLVVDPRERDRELVVREADVREVRVDAGQVLGIEVDVELALLGSSSSTRHGYYARGRRRSRLRRFVLAVAALVAVLVVGTIALRARRSTRRGSSRSTARSSRVSLTGLDTVPQNDAARAGHDRARPRRAGNLRVPRERRSSRGSRDGVLTGALAERRRRRMIEQLSDHYIICGYGRVGRRVADEFREAGVRVRRARLQPGRARGGARGGRPRSSRAAAPRTRTSRRPGSSARAGSSPRPTRTRQPLHHALGARRRGRTC